MSDLKYTITKWDTENKIIDVIFSDNGWANIHLREPLPSNQQELEKIIRQFAAPIEAIQARTNPSVDLGYINGLVGTQYTTTRFSVNNPNPDVQMTNPNAPTPPTPQEIQKRIDFQKLQMQKEFGDFLVNQKLLDSNPITPEMIDAVRPTPPEATQAQPVTQGMQTI